MIIKKNDITPERPVILVIYGQPGCGKTSAAVTAENPLLIDTDRGYDRACLRVDTLEAMNWQDIDRELEAWRASQHVGQVLEGGQDKVQVRQGHEPKVFLGR